MVFFQISISTKIERNEAIIKVRDAIVGCDGWIVTHALFSNILATINFEMPCNKAELFIAKLESATFNPNIDGELPKGEEGDLRGQISITFIKTQETTSFGRGQRQ
jgi:hypothetical protein